MKIVRPRASFVDFKLLILLTVFYTIFEIIYVLKLFYFFNQSKNPWPNHFAALVLIDYILVISFMTLVAITTKRLIVKKVKWTYIFILHFILGILISFLIRIAVDSYVLWMEGKSIWELNTKKFMDDIIFNLDINFVVYFAMLLMIYTYYYRQEIIQNEIQREILKSQLLSTKLKMLTTQLQPHFLFNTLNGISSLITIDKKQAQDMVADLGSVLWEILYHSNSTFTTVEKELNLLEKFCNLLKTRYWDQLTIEQRIQESVLNIKMPAMLLQPIIENATKHGFGTNIPHLTITVSAYTIDDLLYLDIENDGKSLEYGHLSSTKGVGLANLKERLKSIYGKNHRFSIKNRKNNPGIICSIVIPIKDAYYNLETDPTPH